jgi:hypothetical protein
MDGTWMLRRALILTFEGKRCIGWFRTRWFSQILEDSKKRRKNWRTFSLLIHTKCKLC